MLKECLDVNEDGKVSDNDLQEVLKYLFKEKWRGLNKFENKFIKKIKLCADCNYN